MVASWPCRVVVNSDGSSDVYTDDNRDGRLSDIELGA
jgi:hypothetical protein